MPRNNNKVAKVKICYRVLLAMIFGWQTFTFIVRYFDGKSNMITVTSVDHEHNQETKHPYYTICPEFTENPDLSESNATLRSVLAETWIKLEMVHFHPLLSEASNTPKKYKTWRLTRVGKNRRLSFVQCYTFDFPNNVVPGTYGGKVNLPIVSKDPHTMRKQKEVREFQIYLHEHPGYLHSFFSLQGKPHATLPGLDQQLKVQNPQSFKFSIRKNIVKKYDKELCDDSENVNTFCLEKYIRSKVNCTLPWRDQDIIPCPPCRWNSNHPWRNKDKSVRCFNPHDLPNQSLCHLEIGPSEHCGNPYWYYGNRSMEEQCLHCDENCTPIDLDDYCTSKESLKILMQELPTDHEGFQEFVRKSGCKLPCTLVDYEMTKIKETTFSHDVYPNSHLGGMVVFELSTESVMTKQEGPAYIEYDFLSDFTGTFGILFGLSVGELLGWIALLFKRLLKYNLNRFEKLAKEIVGMILLGLAMYWMFTGHLKFSQESKRLESVTTTKENRKREIPLPLLTFCPEFVTDLFVPAKGFIQSEMTFEKYLSTMARNFLSRSFPYKGTWSRKWRFYQNDLFKDVSYGQLCRTYAPHATESSKIVLEFDRRELEGLTGIIHDRDGYEMAFLHKKIKTSDIQFHIPYNHPRYKDSAPNFYSYSIGTSFVNEMDSGVCEVLEPEHWNPDCYLNYLEEELGCKLGWDYQQKDKGNYVACEFPFMHNNVKHNSCIQTGSHQGSTWCATAVYGTTREVYKEHWEYCLENHDRKNNATANDTRPLCSTRDDLESLLSLSLDKKSLSHQTIARNLTQAGCPFPCQYFLHEAKLLYQGNDPALGRDKLSIQFELPNNDFKEEVNEDFYYNIDMFLSDIGNACGFLVNLSLVALVNLFLNSSIKVAFLVHAKVIARFSRKTNASWGDAFAFLKWLLVLAALSYFIGHALTRSAPVTAYLGNEAGQDLKSTSAMFQNRITSIHISKQKLSAPNCEHLDHVGDGFCDEVANVERCAFDGGDCCNSKKLFKPNMHRYCSNCSCLHPAGESVMQLKPGNCEFCQFPFKTSEEDNQLNLDCAEVMNVEDHANSKAMYSFCPFSVDERTRVHIPFFVVNCPEKEAWEEVPTCFFNRSSYLQTRKYLT